MKRSSTLFICLFLFLSFRSIAQVAINSDGSDANSSAALDVKSSNKGLLIPRISLQSLTDNQTINLPAVGLLVYNVNTALPGGAGFYYNEGVPAGPKWVRLSTAAAAGNAFTLPFDATVSTAGNAFDIRNSAGTASSSAITGKNDAGIGTQGRTITGRGVQAISTGSGTGLFAFSQTGNALEVNGKLKIAGGNLKPAAGKVLTSDANGNATWEGASAFSLSAPENIIHIPNAGKEQRLKFGKTDFDLAGNYNSGLRCFVAPADGIYHFDVQLTGDLHLTFFDMLLRLQRGAKKSILARSFVDGDLPNKLSLDVKLESGDLVYLTLTHNQEQYIILSTDEGANFFNGRLVVKL